MDHTLIGAEVQRSMVIYYLRLSRPKKNKDYRLFWSINPSWLASVLVFFRTYTKVLIIVKDIESTVLLRFTRKETLYLLWGV